KPFDDDSDEAKAKRRERGKKDFVWFLNTYLPHHFNTEWDTRRKEATKYTKIKNELIMIQAFRGFAKSTIFVTGYGIYAALYHLTNYITITSDTEDQAEFSALSIRTELAENPRIKQDYGSQKSHEWATDLFVTVKGIAFKCFGWQSKYLGTRYMQHRPGIAFIDDLENEINVLNPDQVKKRHDYVLQSVLPAMAEQFQIFYLTTKLARHCVATELEKNNAVIKFILPSEDENGRATCPKSYPKKRLAKIKRIMGIVGYSKHYLLKIISDEDAAFQEEWFVFINKPDDKYKRIVSFLDASVGSKKNNDFKALITVGWNGETYDVLDAWIRKTTIDHMIRATYNRYSALRPHVIGVETNGFQKLLKREFERSARTFGFQLPIRQKNQKEPKPIRILRLSPLCENGLIRFVKKAGNMNRLTDQILDYNEYSDTVNDDGPDALESAIEILNKMVGKGSQAQGHIL
ncbi:MAG: hypothetical protein ACE5I1_07680, partial [bacterium]